VTQMAENKRPQVLVVDDHADEEHAKLLKWEADLDLRIRHPQDVDFADIRDADLVVVDYVIDDWPEREAASCIALKPPNGLALTATLKGYDAQFGGSPTAFLLRSAHLSELSNGIPPETRFHVIARQYDLEWAQSKTEDIVTQLRQIQSLAKATSALPSNWPNDDPVLTKTLVQTWLCLPDLEWNEIAWQEIEECHPPLYEMANQRAGLRFLRWFLHRILPYPCFLWTTGRLAVRLRVTIESLQAALDNGLGELFSTSRYAGCLHDFQDTRWWRSGCETTLWKVTDGRSFDPEATLEILNKHCNGTLKRSEITHPIMCVDENYQLTNEVIEIELGVRIQPDDWPSFAEHAWISIERARSNHRVRATVLSIDRDRVSDDSGSSTEVG
jgi:hypothetical protein